MRVARCLVIVAMTPGVISAASISVTNLGSPTFDSSAVRGLTAFEVVANSQAPQQTVNTVQFAATGDVHQVWAGSGQPTVLPSDRSGAGWDTDWNDLDSGLIFEPNLRTGPGLTESNDGSNPAMLDVSDGGGGAPSPVLGQGELTTGGDAVGVVGPKASPSLAFVRLVLPAGGEVTVQGRFGFGPGNVEPFSTTIDATTPGDMNSDGVVNNLDINPFVTALTDPTAFEDEFGIEPVAPGDINGDGQLNNLDINPFVDLLTGGSPRVVPEPASLFILGPGGLALMHRRRSKPAA